MLPSAEGPGAIPVLLHAQLLALSSRHEITLVTGIGDEPWEAAAAQAIAPGVSLHLADRRRPTGRRRRLRRQVELAGSWTLTRRPWRAVWFGPRAVQRVLTGLMDGGDFDIVVVEDIAMASLLASMSIPSVLTDHEVRRALPLPGPGSETLLARALSALDWRKTERFGPARWRRYDLLQVFTEADRAEMVRRDPSLEGRVRVNPFGIEIPPEADPALELPNTVLFLGNFTHPPNVDAAAWLVEEIMPVVWKVQPDAVLRIVGSNPPSEVRCLLRPRVELVADAESVEPDLAEAAVCVAPVRQGGGMRMKVLSALVAGKPVVATERGAEGYLRSSGMSPILVADDASGLAGHIASLLGDPVLRHRLGRLAREYAVEHHSPDAWGRRLDAAYAEARR
jgi:glycosyltransferase involved in cell wall biosynthesis